MGMDGGGLREDGLRGHEGIRDTCAQKINNWNEKRREGKGKKKGKEHKYGFKRYLIVPPSLHHRSFCFSFFFRLS